MTKIKGHKASIVGIFNYQGAITEFNQLKKVNDLHRESFYSNIKQLLKVPDSLSLEQHLHLLLKENPFLEPSMLLT